MNEKLISFNITAEESNQGWAPWKLVIDFPKDIEKKLFLPVRIPEGLRNLAPTKTPFNSFEITSSLLRRLGETYPPYSTDLISRAHFRYFLTDLRDAFLIAADELHFDR